jgi:hypothetical protein
MPPFGRSGQPKPESNYGTYARNAAERDAEVAAEATDRRMGVWAALLPPQP